MLLLLRLRLPHHVCVHRLLARCCPANCCSSLWPTQTTAAGLQRGTLATLAAVKVLKCDVSASQFARAPQVLHARCCHARDACLGCAMVHCTCPWWARVAYCLLAVMEAARVLGRRFELADWEGRLRSGNVRPQETSATQGVALSPAHEVCSWQCCCLSLARQCHVSRGVDQSVLTSAQEWASCEWPCRGQCLLLYKSRAQRVQSPPVRQAGGLHGRHQLSLVCDYYHTDWPVVNCVLRGGTHVRRVQHGPPAPPARLLEQLHRSWTA